MRRILVMLSVVALMVVMLAMSVAPAFAGWETGGTDAGCRFGDLKFPDTIPGAEGVDGKRSDDGHVCVKRTNGGVKIYDNRP
jgi:hypothetical protein